MSKYCFKVINEIQYMIEEAVESALKRDDLKDDFNEYLKGIVK